VHWENIGTDFTPTYLPLSVSPYRYSTFSIDWDTRNLPVTSGLVRAIANDGIENSRPDTARIYDFSMGAGVDRWAWQWGGEQSPLSRGSSATSQDYIRLARSDGSAWVTSLATQEGQYDTQMYTFRITQPLSDIEAVEVDWEGSGEGQPGYPTTLLVWNYRTRAWEPLDSKGGMGTEGWLTRTITGQISDYISTDGHLTVMAKKRYSNILCCGRNE
ncbi:MAG: hypothetical protein ACK4GQ_06520, partial [Candidatus Hadarchaeales archaeon]